MFKSALYYFFIILFSLNVSDLIVINEIMYKK